MFGRKTFPVSMAILVSLALSACCDDTGPRVVFLTETLHDGNLGGLPGADAICQAEADAAGLPGTFMAWLSTPGSPPAGRFPTHSCGPYQLVDGTVIADEWADLTDGDLDHHLDLTAAGNPNDLEDKVWSATSDWGTTLYVDGVAETCSGWLSNDPTLVGHVGTKVDCNGYYCKTGTQCWTDKYDQVGPQLCLHWSAACSDTLPLYCFQQ